MRASVKNLIELDWQQRCAKTRMRHDYVPRTKFSDTTANGLEKCIVAWCTLHGWLCERVKNQGRYVDTSTTVTDVMGYTKRIGSGKYIPSTGRNGTADCRAVIKGRSVSFEVKIGKDRQSDAQKKYQEDVERSGGLYYIIKDFDEFIEVYNEIMNNKI